MAHYRVDMHAGRNILHSRCLIFVTPEFGKSGAFAVQFWLTRLKCTFELKYLLRALRAFAVQLLLPYLRKSARSAVKSSSSLLFSFLLSASSVYSVGPFSSSLHFPIFHGLSSPRLCASARDHLFSSFFRGFLFSAPLRLSARSPLFFLPWLPLLRASAPQREITSFLPSAASSSPRLCASARDYLFSSFRGFHVFHGPIFPAPRTEQLFSTLPPCLYRVFEEPVRSLRKLSAGGERQKCLMLPTGRFL